MLYCIRRMTHWVLPAEGGGEVLLPRGRYKKRIKKSKWQLQQDQKLHIFACIRHAEKWRFPFFLPPSVPSPQKEQWSKEKNSCGISHRRNCSRKPKNWPWGSYSLSVLRRTEGPNTSEKPYEVYSKHSSGVKTNLKAQNVTTLEALAAVIFHSLLWAWWMS